MRNILYALVLLLLLSPAIRAQSIDITAEQFKAVEDKANDLLKTSTYRMTRRLEYFAKPGQAGVVEETTVREVVQPDKWRTVEETGLGSVVKKSERLWDGKALYVRENGGEWTKFSGGGSASGRIETGRITTSYRFLGRTSLDGVAADKYEVGSTRIANKFSMTSMIVVTYIRRTTFFYDATGRPLKRVEFNGIEGRDETSVETVIYEYDPKIKIEAPIK